MYAKKCTEDFSGFFFHIKSKKALSIKNVNVILFLHNGSSAGAY